MTASRPRRRDDSAVVGFDEVSSPIPNKILAATQITFGYKVECCVIQHQGECTVRMHRLSVGLDKLKNIDRQVALCASFSGVACHPHANLIWLHHNITV